MMITEGRLIYTDLHMSLHGGGDMYLKLVFIQDNLSTITIWLWKDRLNINLLVSSNMLALPGNVEYSDVPPFMAISDIKPHPEVKNRLQENVS